MFLNALYFPAILIGAIRFHDLVRKHRVLKAKFTVKTTQKTPTKNPQKKEGKSFHIPLCID